ncbi:peptidylprolyl isomerase [Povalibacter sp.]|uniref:peptidylprolyl isomerase n=1 Tax=Povalibacter sp. TaxID=1962978 RepID=UPI002F40CCD2
MQFLAIALVLFAANQFIHGSEPRPSGDLITISRGRVQQIADSYRLLAGRSPSRAELQALVDDFADEEVAYREAVAMGLDADDTIVRRRMRQKLEFLAEDAGASEEPTNEQLVAWLSAHQAEYRLPERISFRQVMVSNDTRRDSASADVASLLDSLRSGADPTKPGDASMLPSALPPTTQRGVAQLFGERFAAEVFAQADNGWFGPVSSPLGSHAVIVLSRESAHDPLLADIRDKLRSDWIESRRRDTREQFQARLRQRYHVVVEWPEVYANQPPPTDVPKIIRPLDTIDSGGE